MRVMLCVNNPSLTHMGNSRPASPAAPAGTVHPHACGERLNAKSPASRVSGSSPRMWGTVRGQPRPSGQCRFIPTHVGNGPATSRSRTPSRGSSPRMWGTVLRLELAVAHPRFIPTHVGNGLILGISDTRRPVHPHACGERRSSQSDHHCINGSSPRMWGTGCR